MTNDLCSIPFKLISNSHKQISGSSKLVTVLGQIGGKFCGPSKVVTNSHKLAFLVVTIAIHQFDLNKCRI